jgi:resuscitation-promoting factor RpfB
MRRYYYYYYRRLRVSNTVFVVSALAAGLALTTTVHTGAHTADAAAHGGAAALGAGTARQGGTPSSNMALGQQLAAADGWTADNGQWSCLERLWTRESGWQNDIMNKDSGAFGIAQALTHGQAGAAAVVAVVYFPDGTSASDVTVNQYPTAAANSGDPRAQITWGLAYIIDTYRSACSAEDHEQANGWY